MESLGGLKNGRRNGSSLSLGNPFVSLNSQGNESIQVIWEDQEGKLVLQGAGQTMQEGIQQGGLVPTTLGGQGPELNGVDGSIASSLTQPHPERCVGILG